MRMPEPRPVVSYFKAKLDWIHRTRVIAPVMIVFLACVSPLDRFGGYKGGQIVISGQISPIPEANVVSVSITSNSERFPEPVDGALVVLSDDAGNQFVYNSEGNGKYLLQNLEGIPGRTYQLRVTLPDGRTYESAYEKMPENIGDDQIYHEFKDEPYTDRDGVVAERTFIKIFTAHAVAPSDQPLYMRWVVEEAYIISPTDFPDIRGEIPPPCYVLQVVEPQKMILFSTTDANATVIPGLLLASRLVDRSFKERHYFTTYQSSLTHEAYEYWRKVNNVANQVGSIFDPPPARLKGNIYNVDDRDEEVHGYFQAVNQKLSRFYLLPDDLPFRMPLHCEYRDTRDYYDYPSECLNCLSVANSSYSRPSWF